MKYNVIVTPQGGSGSLKFSKINTGQLSSLLAMHFAQTEGQIKKVFTNLDLFSEVEVTSAWLSCKIAEVE